MASFQDKVHILYDRHLRVSIEWGGVPDMFSSMSDLDEDLAVLLLFGLKSQMSKKGFNELITNIVQQQHERDK